MFPKLRYYDLGRYHVCWHVKGIFCCENSETHHKHTIDNKVKQFSPTSAIVTVGEYVWEEIDYQKEVIDNNITKHTSIKLSTKAHKGMKANCQCGGKYVWKGWRVWVEDVKNVKEMGGLFRTGTKIVYERYCKTLKTRREVIDRLYNKYSNKGNK